MVRYRAASAMAPIPFDKHGVPGTIEIVEDFIEIGADSAEFADTTGILVTTLPPHQWWGTEIAGDGAPIASHTVGVADHPGILKLDTGQTTPADGDAAALQFGGSASAVQDHIVLDSNGIYMAWVLRVPDVDAQVTEVGFSGQAPAVGNSSALDIIAWSFDPEDADNVGDAFWFAQVNGAGTDVEKIATAVPYVQGDWVLLEMAADSSSATFRITTEDNTQTLTLDSSDGVVMPIVALRPYVTVEAVGNAQEIVEVDLFVLRYIRRDALVASWLGA